jgi:hypothetical protein
VSTQKICCQTIPDHRNEPPTIGLKNKDSKQKEIKKFLFYPLGAFPKNTLNDKINKLDMVAIIIIVVLLIASTVIAILSPSTKDARIEMIITPLNEANISDHFQIKADIKNIGTSPVFDVKASIEIDKGLNLMVGETKEKTIGVIEEGSSTSVRWWLNSTEPGEKIIRINASSLNAENAMEIIAVKFQNTTNSP